MDLTRQTFKTSREIEYFTQKELRSQIGYDSYYWPLAVLRELIDNALDACEMAGVSPLIDIEIQDDRITVSDNGPGISPEVIEKSLDYLIRVSDKAHYVSPTRGAMGNALKVVWAAPFVTSGESLFEVISRGEKHTIRVGLDLIAGKPCIKHFREPFVRNGTFVNVQWPKSSGLLFNKDPDYFYNIPTADDLIESYSAFNPHAAFKLNNRLFPLKTLTWRKWNPCMPTSAHWYTPETLRNLIAAYIAHGRNGGRPKTVREFVSEFRGLSSTIKQKEVTAAWSGSYLHDFVADGDVDKDFVVDLLLRMQSASVPPKASMLGVIGGDSFKAWLPFYRNIDRSSIQYACKKGGDGLPYVIEAAFAILNEGEQRQVISGLNWSPVIGGSPDPTIADLLQNARIDPHDPVILMIHIARPRFDFMDRGKTRTSFTGQMKRDLESVIKGITEPWKKLKRKADKEDRVTRAAIEQMLSRPPRVSVKDAAFQVMEAAYMKASSNERYFANARQIMYAARPNIIRLTGKSKPWKNSSYFTQTLLKDYIEEKNPTWKKVVWDARGHFIEPHTRKSVGIGGSEIIAYEDQWTAKRVITQPEINLEKRVRTVGPTNRFHNVLFIEKEGFTEILQDAGIQERYSMALMSTKGLPTGAACNLIADCKKMGVNVFVLHDFDLAGFKILRTLEHGTRLTVGSDVIELGFRLEDIEGLDSEEVIYEQGADPRDYLRDYCGATEEEASFLVTQKRFRGHYEGRRVELNAMTSEELIAWLEGKFQQHGVKKYIPEEEVIRAAFKRAVFLRRVEEKIIETRKEIESQSIDLPDSLYEKTQQAMENTSKSWDDAVWELAKGDR